MYTQKQHVWRKCGEKDVDITPCELKTPFFLFRLEIFLCLHCLGHFLLLSLDSPMNTPIIGHIDQTYFLLKQNFLVLFENVYAKMLVSKLATTS